MSEDGEKEGVMASGGTVILVTRNGLGFVEPDDANFGVHMFSKLLDAIEQRTDKPRAICFFTEGVKLVCQGSAVIRELGRAQASGVQLVACRTCLEYYELLDRQVVGDVGAMGSILALLAGAEKVITV